jgi:hypothetical protein
MKTTGALNRPQAGGYSVSQIAIAEAGKPLRAQDSAAVEEAVPAGAPVDAAALSVEPVVAAVSAPAPADSAVSPAGANSNDVPQPHVRAAFGLTI